MLTVQKYLRENGTVDQLQNDLGLKIIRHPNDPIFILNYSQIDSPKTNEIVRNCRGLVLEDGSFDIVARSFNRFFNWGEVVEEGKLFNWNDFTASDKLDGSLILLYYYKGTWRVNTKGSFGNGEVNSCGKTWTQLFHECIPYDRINEMLNPNETYVFEYCSLYNKVVIRYDNPEVYLLTVFNNKTNTERSKSYSDNVAAALSCDRPKNFCFESHQDILDYISSTQYDEVVKELDEDGHEVERVYVRYKYLYEGFVICDNEGRRWKIKAPQYLCLHRMRGEGDNLFHPRYLLPWVLQNNGDELLTYYGDVKEAYEEMKVVVDGARDKLMELWEEVKDIKDQKTFAQTIIPRTKFSSLLFQARSKDVHPKVLWYDSPELILKILYNK